MIEQGTYVSTMLGKFTALANHLGCDPAELEGLDLVELVEASKSLITLSRKAMEELAPGGFKEMISADQIATVNNAFLACDHLQNALAQLPERKT